MTDDTIAVYNAKAAEYAALTETLGERAELERFASALPPGGRVIDLGCGPGFYAAWLATQGFAVDATDASAEMVALASARKGVCVKQATFGQFAAVAAYDGIWANFSLLHVPRADFPDHLARLHKALKPGGLLHLGMKLGQGEGPDRIGRFYAYYTEGELVRFVTSAGFTIIERHVGEGAGLSGSVEPYITVLCHA